MVEKLATTGRPWTGDSVYLHIFCELDCVGSVLYGVDTNVPLRPPIEQDKEDTHTGAALHPAWLEFMRFCRQMRHGEIDQLRIQDGLPLLAQTVRKKVKFTKQ